MNLKKIWMLGILFGLVASILFYYATTSKTASISQATDGQLSAEAEVAGASTTEASAVENREKKDSEQLLNIENGKRAISIPVNKFQSVSGFILPGNHVDIISIMPTQQGQATKPEILLENIKVLATGDQTEVQPESETEQNAAYEFITLEVTPEQGKALANAAQNGFVTFMLRDADDTIQSQQSAKTEAMDKGGTAQ